ncbi:MAG: hypothetical protein JXR76_11745 [Deltaproteobacteria bacterium]|nr:hypothetical protein [Deltaproteobacteria bacterium]
MKFSNPFAILIALCTIWAAAPVFADNDTSSNGMYSFQLESDGYSLPTWYWNGYTYVEGRRGERYNIRVFNHSGQRVEAVVTVDGRDAITGQPGNYKKNRGYVIEPYSSVLIKGFRTSWRDVAGFYFTDIDNSYSARMGTKQNVGVIGVAVFEEKTRREYRRPIRVTPAPRKRGLGTGYGNARPTEEKEASQSRDADAAAPSTQSQESAGRRTQRQRIGTGYGHREYSPATSTEFKRRTRNPGARLAIYYDDRQSLVERGIIPGPRPPVYPAPHPFPENNDPGFAPPPPPAHYWE